MKRVFQFAFILVATSMVASAASISWKSDALSFGGVSLKGSTAVTGYLVYISSGALASSYTVDENFSASSVGVVAHSSTTLQKNGGPMGTANFGTTYGNGDSFALLISYADAASGKTYWTLSETVNKLSGLNPADPTVAPAEWGNFAAATGSGTDGTLTAGGGWVAAAAVPEPATGALALAGIALLFKRRKARA